MAIIFDSRVRVKRWRDTETGRFVKEPGFVPEAPPPPPPEPEWEIQIEYDYRKYGAKRISPPLNDMVPIPWIGQKPTSFDVLEAIRVHEATFRLRRIFVFNQSSIVVPTNELARLAGD